VKGVYRALEKILSIKRFLQLPTQGKIEHVRDIVTPVKNDPGIDRAIRMGMAWLCWAQDNSLSKDGGVARDYSLVNGWSSSYPETTGYIIPTMIAYAKKYQDITTRSRAKRMLDWLVAIQFPDGGFQGGLIDSTPIVPVVFNTGQILLGLASGVREFGEEYRDSMRRAADWLVRAQDHDGCWRRYPTPFAAPGEKAYETHVAWGLLESAKESNNSAYKEAALKNIRWALTMQRDNGWFDKCCLVDPSQPLTHTIGYALRGIIEAYRSTKDQDVLKACVKTADGLVKVADMRNGFIPGRINSEWEGTVSWACLTGSVQIALCWMMLYQDTAVVHYRDAAFVANSYVRRTIRMTGSDGICGGVKGSFPVYGDYGKYEYLNWASKFFIDSNMMEDEIRELDNMVLASD